MIGSTDWTWMEAAARCVYQERDGEVYSMLSSRHAEKREVIFDLLYQNCYLFMRKWRDQLAQANPTRQLQIKKYAITQLRKYVDEHRERLGWHFAPARSSVPRGNNRWVIIPLGGKFAKKDLDIINAARIEQSKGHRTVIKRLEVACQSLLTQTSSPSVRQFLEQAILSLDQSHENLVFYEKVLETA